MTSQRKRPYLLHALVWLLRAGGWQRITIKCLFIGKPEYCTLWVRHRFREWTNP